MALILVASASLAIMAGLIGTVLTEFTDAFWNLVDDLGMRLRRVARHRCGTHRAPHYAVHRRITGRQ